MCFNNSFCNLHIPWLFTYLEVALPLGSYLQLSVQSALNNQGRIGPFPRINNLSISVSCNLQPAGISLAIYFFMKLIFHRTCGSGSVMWWSEHAVLWHQILEAPYRRAGLQILQAVGLGIDGVTLVSCVTATTDCSGGQPEEKKAKACGERRLESLRRLPSWTRGILVLKSAFCF